MSEETKLTPEETKMLIRAQYDFPYFCEHIIGQKLPEFMLSISDVVVNRRETKLVCLVIPRGHSKTNTFSVNYSVWRMWKDKMVKPSEAIEVLSANRPLSFKIVGEIQEIFETNKYLSYLVPAKNEENWNKSRITLTNKNTCMVVTYGPSARGLHPDIIIIDDPLKDNENSHEEIIEIFKNIIVGQMEPHTQVIVVCTPQTQQDLLAYLKEKCKTKNKWSYIWRSAVETDGLGTSPEHWTKLLWPEHWTMEEMIDKYDLMGRASFNRELLCNPTAEGTSFFSLKDINKTLDKNLGFSNEINGICYIGCDFAYSEGKHGDYSVSVVVDYLEGKEHIIKDKLKDEVLEFKVKNPIIIKYMDRYKGMKPHMQVNRLKELQTRFNPTRFIVDGTSCGVTFPQEIRNFGGSVESQNFDPNSRRDLLTHLSLLIEKHRIVFPYSDECEDMNKKINRLIKELDAMEETKTKGDRFTVKSRADHDDCTMGLALAVKNIQIESETNQGSLYGCNKLPKRY